MNKRLRIVLRAGERIFLNGAVIKVDRKVGVELLNDVVFLLEQHVMKVEDTKTPLKQLYFMIQMMLMDPSLHMKARQMAADSITSLRETVTDEAMRTGLLDAEKCLNADRPLNALKAIRSLFPVEDAIMSRSAPPMISEREVA